MLNVYDHILDPNERRRLLLSEIDKAPFGWYHVRAVVVAGAGFFTDAYDVCLSRQAVTGRSADSVISKIYAINLTTAMLGLVYWQHSHNGTMPSSSETAIKVATSVGAVIGQLVFGYAADWLGRRKMYGIELIIILAATLAQSLSGSSTALSLVGVMVFWRLVMGIGIGGDYPLSAVITSEYVYSLSPANRGSI
jgi:PHS family inorganic phosphate transporter-like MFS transporter